ncbi:HAMP domain-containing histidine kinase [Brevibacillus ruminantium]|uniref:histidine kinase n=1 Tax=Brevibacillus ruminantium TaxID=2950604 RepID=A0ABY4WL35_9BACL|nr:HAMP domain-containing sensor histidine kinase [Brevibacillus ruminantium]USG67842.1 HAMP domain-containing histidine kinase [Brevibacillus ruminantium]
MKLETKISLILIIIFLTIGAIFFITGFSALNLLNNLLGINGLVTYAIFPLLFIGMLILIGLLIERQIRKPLFFFIRWIDQLSLGVFKMPDTIKNFPLDKMRFSLFLELKSKLDGLTYQLNTAEKERKELEETRKNWTSGVTHDLKTPLSYIKGYAAMLRSEHKWNEEEIKEFAKIIEEKSLYMEQLIDDLSVIYEFDKMQIPLDLRTINLVTFVKNVLEDLRQYPMANDYPIHLNVKNEGDILLSFDQTLLKRALENFIMNAIYHNPRETTITVSIETIKGSTLIEIKDNGIGMDDKTIQQLFNQYYRGTTTDKSHLGSGLGMSIAKQFIEKQGGQIIVESEPNRGTKIKILFPL